MVKLEQDLLTYMKDAIRSNKTTSNNMYFNFEYDKILDKKGNDLEEFLKDNNYSIEDIHITLDTLERKELIIKKGICKTYANIYLK